MTTNVLSSNPAHGEVYSMHHYVIKFVSATTQYTYKCTMQCLRNNYIMSCFMLILTWGGIIFVDISHQAKARCKILRNIIPGHVKMSIEHNMR